MIRAVIFDFDGTILDTESPDYHSWREVYDEHGCPFPRSTWASGIGTMGSRFDAHAHLEAFIGRSLDREAIRLRRRHRNLELIDAEPVRPGVVEYLTGAVRIGLRIGLASSSPRAWVEGHLDRLGLLHHFECLRCSEDVRQVKPDPELYQTAVAALGVRPEQALAIEDSHHGMLAARAAGLACVIVPNEMTREHRFDQADLVLGSLADLPIDRLLRRLALR